MPDTDMKDAFISYARLDDVPPGSGQTGWIARFQHTLNVRLNSLRGQVNEVWWDPTLEGNQDFARTIETQLRQVKALISVTSPRYFKSDWCRREVLAFLAAAEATGGFVLGDRARLFKVLKTPVPEEDLPADLPPALRDLHRQLLGYSFYDLDPKTKRPREFSPEFG
jgi:hypothetical protein